MSLGGAREERLIALDISSWLETEIQQSQGFDFLQKSHKVSDLLPIISNSLLNKLNNSSWLEDEIREKLAYKSFQQPNKIAKAIQWISNEKLWDEVANKLGKTAQEIKQELGVIVDRRNKIAHEADIDPTYGIGNRWNIDEIMVSEAVDFIEQLVETIHQVIV